MSVALPFLAGLVFGIGLVVVAIAAARSFREAARTINEVTKQRARVAGNATVTQIAGSTGYCGHCGLRGHLTAQCGEKNEAQPGLADDVRGTGA